MLLRLLRSYRPRTKTDTHLRVPTQGNTTATHSENMAEEGDNSPPIVSEPQPASIPLHWQMLSAAVLAQITVSIVTQGVPTLAPFIQADLGLSHAQVGLCNSAIMTGSLCSMFLAGWVVDTYGERSALVWGAMSRLESLFGVCPWPCRVLSEETIA